jgi:putative salt-induced outer membrane protein
LALNQELILPKSKIVVAGFAAFVVASMPTAAMAELPEPVRAMIDAAFATGDETKVRTVIDIARTTNPDDGAELDRLLAGFETQLAKTQAEEAAAKEAAIRSAGIFQNWTGQGELGAFMSSGNADNTGLTTSLALTKDGINWRHKLAARADYQRSEGVTTREQFLAAYEVNYKITDRLFAYALGQYERDRFQGFGARYSASGGLGYDVLQDGPTLSVKAGPAWRRTELIAGGSTNNLAGLAAVDFDWAISDTITFTQDANALIQSGSSTLVSDTGLQASISDALSVRLSYTVEHDTDPPAGAVKTDTLSRITVIYGF